MLGTGPSKCLASWDRIFFRKWDYVSKKTCSSVIVGGCRLAGGGGGRGWSLAIGDGWWCLVLVVGVGAIDCLKDCLDEKINPKCTVSVYSDNMFTGNVP